MSNHTLGNRPFWHHEHHPESRLPVSLVVMTVIVLQLSLPRSLSSPYLWIICVVEAALLVAINVLDPRHIRAHEGSLRWVGIALIGTMTLANVYSISRLIYQLVDGNVKDATSLLLTGGSIWLTNVVVFALWYWEFDRGGPAARSIAKRQHPDFMFPQMSDPELAAPHWAPRFLDYCYMSLTNSSAFSPTDVLPLTRWAKATMALQSTTSLLVVALVIARAVNILH